MSKKYISMAAVIFLFTAAGLCGCAADSVIETPVAAAETGKVSTMEGYLSRYHPAHISSAEAWDMVTSDNEALMLDVRSEASYVESHVSVAVNVPYESLADYAEKNLQNKERAIICYCFCGDKGGSALSAYNILTDMGYTSVYYTEPGDEWAYEGTAVSGQAEGSVMDNIVTGAEAKEICGENAAAILLDVRNQSEYDEGYIEGSVLIPVAELGTRLSELPDKSAVIIVYCKTGRRSAAACELLTGQGYTNVYDMQSVYSWPDSLVTETPSPAP